jgi:hypothetical protein
MPASALESNPWFFGASIINSKKSGNGCIINTNLYNQQQQNNIRMRLIYAHSKNECLNKMPTWLGVQPMFCSHRFLKIRQQTIHSLWSLITIIKTYSESVQSLITFYCSHWTHSFISNVQIIGFRTILNICGNLPKKQPNQNS